MRPNFYFLTVSLAVTFISVLSGKSAFAYTRQEGAKTCLDIESVFKRFESLPADQLVRTQVTDIAFVSGASAEAFELGAIQNLYEAKLEPKSKAYDGSRTFQTGCEGIDTIYKNGRSDHYEIVSATQDQLDLVDSFHRVIKLRLVNERTIESTFTVPVGLCGSSANSMEGLVRVTSVQTWGSPLTEIQVSTNLLEKLEPALKSPPMVCQVK